MKMHSTFVSFPRLFVMVGTLAFVGLARPAQAAENPMEQVGVQHNAMLSCLYKVDPSGSSDPFQLMVDVCGLRVDMTGAEFSEEYSQRLPSDPLAPMDEQLKPYREEFSEEQYKYIEEMERVLTTQEPAAAAKSLASLESRAAGSLGSEKGDLAVLSGLSTAKYSLRFWLNGSDPVPAKKAKWWQVVLGDVVGAVVGSLVGGPAGAAGLGAACSEAVASL